ncbi:hypothetical protein QFC19_004108 [Naganishia cerealis]|uniref:Uncharacterized protein n=1 Tax=Naganishia cerealis TaxID=610337 RepID=A0ACC2VXC6_9TREE|nr:hypothetical protein QFC19_004108 [Naganishia cerealis]
MSGKRYVKDVPPDSTRLGASTARYKGTLTTRQIQVISFLIQLILVAYGEYHDRHSVLKYTDVDYRVFSDAVHALWMPSKKDGNIAQGPLTRWMGWEIGE